MARIKDKMTCIKLYTRNKLKGTFYLRQTDAVEIGFWWHSLDKENYSTFEKIKEYF